MKNAALRWFLVAVLVFWGSTAVALFADCVGVTCCGIDGSDMDYVIFVPLTAAQITAGCFLVIAIDRMVAQCKTWWGAGLTILLGVLFAGVNFVAGYFAAFAFLVGYMGHPI